MSSQFGAPRFLVPAKDAILAETDAGRLAEAVTGRPGPAILLQRRHRNEVFQISDYGVLKVYAEDAEARALSNMFGLLALRESELPTPKPLASGQLRSGHWWTLEEFLAHEPPQIGSLKEHEHQHEILGRALREVHRTRGVTYTGRLTNVRTACAMHYALARLESAAAGVDRGALPCDELAALTTALTTVAEGPDCAWESVKPVLVHGSYTGTNAIVDLRANRLTALFDFEEAHYGDPAEDLAWVAMYGINTATWAMTAAYESPERRRSLLVRICLWSVIYALEILAWADRAGDTTFARIARERCRSALVCPPAAAMEVMRCSANPIG